MAPRGFIYGASPERLPKAPLPVYICTTIPTFGLLLESLRSSTQTRTKLYGITYQRFEVSLRLTVGQSVSQSVCLGVESTLWTFDQILLPFQECGSGICCPVTAGCPL
jgi:hypothetical protein